MDSVRKTKIIIIPESQSCMYLIHANRKDLIVVTLFLFGNPNAQQVFKRKFSFKRFKLLCSSSIFNPSNVVSKMNYRLFVKI